MLGAICLPPLPEVRAVGQRLHCGRKGLGIAWGNDKAGTGNFSGKPGARIRHNNNGPTSCENAASLEGSTRSAAAAFCGIR
jgi:hypothetical protein